MAARSSQLWPIVAAGLLWACRRDVAPGLPSRSGRSGSPERSSMTVARDYAEILQNGLDDYLSQASSRCAPSTMRPMDGRSRRICVCSPDGLYRGQDRQVCAMLWCPAGDAAQERAAFERAQIEKAASADIAIKTWTLSDRSDGLAGARRVFSRCSTRPSRRRLTGDASAWTSTPSRSRQRGDCSARATDNDDGDRAEHHSCAIRSADERRGFAACSSRLPSGDTD